MLLTPLLTPPETNRKMLFTNQELHKDQALCSPARFIDHTFARFAVGGENASSILGHWSGFLGAHEVFLDEIEYD